MALNRRGRDEGGWTKVISREEIRRRKGKWEATTTEGQRGEGDNKSTTIFFTEFAKRWKARGLYNVFKTLGNIEEVIISKKRDNRRRQYGFVRFFDVRDPIRLAMKMDNMFLEGRKLFANIPKFARDGAHNNLTVSKDHGGVVRSQKGEGVMQKNKEHQCNQRRHGGFRGMSYVEATRGNVQGKRMNKTSHSDSHTNMI